MSRLLVAAALAALLLGPVASADAKSYKGKTRQGRGVIVRTGADGVVASARIGWRAPCGQGLRYSANTVFRKPLDVATTDVIQDAGSYRVRLRGGLRARITGTFAGQRDPATDRWSGTWAVKVRVTRRGKTVDRCQLKRATWEAR